MGDRRNVIIKDDRGVGVGLYSHWGGTELPAVVAAAMRRASSRWSDAAYLARAIFCEMVKDDVMSELGYGISSADNLCEGSSRDITVDCEKQMVQIERRWMSFSSFANGKGEEV